MDVNFEVCTSFPLSLYRRFLSLYVVPNEVKEQGKAIDLGCGAGTILLELKKHYRHQLTGVDISPPSIETCRRNPELSDASTTLIEKDVMALTEMPELRHAFDLVVSYSCFHLVKGSTPEKFQLLHYLAKPGAIIAVDALPNIWWNRFLFRGVRFLSRVGIAKLAIRVFGPWLAPGMPKTYIKDLSGITYTGRLDFSNFIDLSYFESQAFRVRFELLRKDIVPQDGFFTGRKLRFCLIKKASER